MLKRGFADADAGRVVDNDVLARRIRAWAD